MPLGVRTSESISPLLNISLCPEACFKGYLVRYRSRLEEESKESLLTLNHNLEGEMGSDSQGWRS